MKKTLSFALVALLIVAILAGCGSSQQSTEPPVDSKPESVGNAGAKDPSSVYACYIMDGALGSQSVADVAWSGFQEAKEKLGVQVICLENIAQADAKDALKTVIQEGVNLVVYQTTYEDLFDKAFIESYPNVTFANIDGKGNAEDYADLAANQYVCSYREHEAAFLQGIFTSMMSKSGKVAEITSSETGTLLRFIGGFRAGVKYMTGEDSAQIVAVGGSDVNKAYESATMLFEQGVDSIACCAAGSNLGVFKAAQELGFVVCGAADGQFTRASDVIMASQVKTINKVTYGLIEKYLENNFPYAQYDTLGIAEGGVDLIYTDQNPELLASIPQEVFDQVDAARKAIIAGEITIPKHPDEVADFTLRAK